MKVVIATAVYYPMINGVAVFSHNLALGLAKRGMEVLVLCPSQTGKNYEVVEEGVRTVYLRSVQVKVYPDQIHEAAGGEREVLGLKMPKLWYRHGFRVSVFPELEVRRVLDGFQPDVVHVQVSDPIGLSVVSYARRRGVPVVTTEHNQPEVLTGSFKAPKLVKRGANVVLSAYFRNRQGKSDFVTMPTEQAIFNLLGSGGKLAEFGVPVAAVSNGVDLSCFRLGKASAQIYEKYGLAREGLKVLYVGRVDPEKQVGKVVEAFAKAKGKLAKGVKVAAGSGMGEALMDHETEPKTEKVELVVVGDGVDRARLMEKAEKMGLGASVRFLGKVLPPDLYELYKVGDVFATASEIETQGIVLIEAVATGLPLIAVNKGAVAEVCRDGENGILCEAGDVAGMAAAMAAILSDAKLRKRFSRRSVEIAGEHDFERTLDKFINIYNRVIQEKGSGAKRRD